MGHVIVFNLYLLFEEIWVPEAWLAELDHEGQPKDLLRRITKAQLTEWEIQADEYVIRLLEWSEKLQYEALDENFSRTVKRKKLSLAEQWAEKEVRQGIEKYITRHLDQFYQLAQKHDVWLSRDAASKPVLAHHLLSFAPAPAQVPCTFQGTLSDYLISFCCATIRTNCWNTLRLSLWLTPPRHGSHTSVSSTGYQALMAKCYCPSVKKTFLRSRNNMNEPGTINS